MNPDPNLSQTQQETDESLYPIAVLIDELKHDDITLRINAVRRIQTIALALGPERTRDELIPFLDESIEDEDELLCILAEELAGFVPLVGGNDYAHLILPPLENLSVAEETTVRNKAVESINKISEILSPKQIEECFIPMVKRLTNGNWFTNKTSAAALFPAAYKRSSPSTQAELRKLYATFCNDDTPMVRRAAGTNFTALLECIQKNDIIADMLEQFEKLSKDDQDSVRLLTVEPLVAICNKMSESEIQSSVGDTIKKLCTEERSWRVRYMLAENFVKLAKAVGPNIVKADLMNAFCLLLRDPEAEVKVSITGQIPGFGAIIGVDEIIAQVLPILQNLAVDTSQHVRASLASNITGLAPILGKEATIELLLPLFLRLLKDEFPDVRLNIISRLEQVNKIIGVELLSLSLLPAIVELAEDKQWRVRLAIIEYIPLLATQLGVDFFDEKLGSLCMSWLGDPVYSIREAATVNLRKLTEVFGVDWAKRTILPKILNMSTHPNHLYRMTTIFAITAISPSLNNEVVKEMILPAVLQLSNDPIPNIRFNSAKSLKIILEVLGKDSENAEVYQEIKATLEKLSKDTDRDVQFFAGLALELVPENMA